MDERKIHEEQIGTLIKSSMNLSYAGFEQFLAQYNANLDAAEVGLQRTAYLLGKLIDSLKDIGILSDEVVEKLLNAEEMDSALSLYNEPRQPQIGMGFWQTKDKGACDCV